MRKIFSKALLLSFGLCSFSALANQLDNYFLHELRSSGDHVPTLEQKVSVVLPPLKEELFIREGKIVEKKGMNTCELSFKKNDNVRIKNPNKKPYAIVINTYGSRGEVETYIEFKKSKTFNRLKCISQTYLTVSQLNKILGQYFQLKYIEPEVVILPDSDTEED